MTRWIVDAEGFKRIIDGSNGDVEVHQPYVKIILRGNGGETVVIIPWNKINQLIFIEE